MLGDRCERECNTDEECGTGTCDATVGRCKCDQMCFTDAECRSGECKDRVCTDGWTGVQCSVPRSNSCVDGKDCNDQECVNGMCVCDMDHDGLRCEKKRVELGEACEVDTNCKDVFNQDTCTGDKICARHKTACETDQDCLVACRSGVCKLPTTEEVDEDTLSDKVMDMIDQLLTPEGVSQMITEEVVEEVVDRTARTMSPYVVKGLKDSVSFYSTRAQTAATRSLVKGGVITPAQAAALKRSIAKSLTNLTTSTAAKNVAAVSAKVTSRLAKFPLGTLYFMVQALGVVLDIDDSAGFSAQIPQDGVDMIMKVILENINNEIQLREAGVQFPREYLPEYTLQFQAKLAGEMADARRSELVKEYIDSLDVNSDGHAILRDYSVPDTEPEDEVKKESARNKVLWALSGKSERAYGSLKTWWWVILVCVCVLILTIGLGVGLTVRSNKNKR